MALQGSPVSLALPLGGKVGDVASEYEGKLRAFGEGAIVSSRCSELARSYGWKRFSSSSAEAKEICESDRHHILSVFFMGIFRIIQRLMPYVLVGSALRSIWSKYSLLVWCRSRVCPFVDWVLGSICYLSFQPYQVHNFSVLKEPGVGWGGLRFVHRLTTRHRYGCSV